MNDKNEKLKNFSKDQKFLILAVVGLFIVICFLGVIVFNKYNGTQKNYSGKIVAEPMGVIYYVQK